MRLSKKVWSILTMSVVLLVLFIPTPNATASQEVVKDKVLNALRDILGIDVDKYTINVTSYRAAPAIGFEKDYKGEELMGMTLDSKESKLSVAAFYLSNQLRYVYTSITEGSSSTVHYINKLSDDPLVAAREVLSRLQAFTDNSDIVDMQRIIEPAKTIRDLENKTVGDIRCTAYFDRNPKIGPSPVLELYFMNAYGGAETPQSISLHFEPDGYFMGFTDCWNLYFIDDGDMIITREQAIVIAWEQASGAAGLAGIDFPSDRPVITELRMGTRGDGLVLYPYWFVEAPLVLSSDLSFNAWQLSIWADTGEVISSHPTAGGYGAVVDGGGSDFSGASLDGNVPSSATRDVNFGNNFLLFVAVVIVIMVIVSVIIIILKKR